MSNRFIAILAGGRSSRMGRDKRFLQIDGENLLDRAVHAAEAVPGVRRDQVFLCGAVPGRECLEDEIPGLGPLAGVLSAVRATRAHARASESFLVVMPVDMPEMKSEYLGVLFDELASSASGHAVHFEGFEMPVVLRVDSEMERQLEGLCRETTDSRRSIQELLRRVDSRVMTCPREVRAAMVNLNCPQDWESFQKENRS